MTALGFEMDYIDEFYNEEYEVFQLYHKLMKT